MYSVNFKNGYPHIMRVGHVYSMFLALLVSPFQSDGAIAQQFNQGQGSVVKTELSNNPGYAVYYVSLLPYDVRVEAGTNKCAFSYTYNGRKSDRQVVYQPYNFYIELPTNLTQDGEITWNSKINIFTALSSYRPLNGNEQNCITKGSIFVRDLYAAAWSGFEAQLNQRRQDGQLCLKYGMDAVGLSYSNIASATSSPIVSPYHPKAQSVLQTCVALLDPSLERVSGCTIGSRRTSCEKVWARKTPSGYIKLRGMKEPVEAKLRGEQIELVSAETDAARAKFEQEQAQRLAEQKRKAEEEERYRQWLQTPEGQKHLAAEKLRLQREQAARAAAEARQREALARDYPYYALVTCTFNGRHATIYPCLNDRISSDIELKNGTSYDIYKPYQVHQIGRDTSDGLIINLKSTFQIKVQNVSNNFILGVQIIERRTGKVLFNQKRGKLGVIAVSS